MNRSPRQLQALLRILTESLAHEAARPGSQHLDWAFPEHTLVRAVAVLHGMSQLLIGYRHECIPEDLARFFVGQRSHIASRHARIEAQLRLIDAYAREYGIAVTPLKGAALHALGIYQPGERPMADIDLLVRPHDAPRAKMLLETLGYREVFASWKERLFIPLAGVEPCALGEHADNDVKIELHERVGERLPLQIADLSACLWPVDPHPGLNDYPSRAALMRHLLLHAAGSISFKALRFIQLHDISLLAARMTSADWDAAIGTSQPHAEVWWASPPLELTEKYFPGCIPQTALEAAASHCPWLLLRLSRATLLSDVSHSHLWVSAFPGIEWSRSWREMARYVVTRFVPGGEHHAARDLTAKTHAWASGQRWVTMPQGQRILRWVLSRQPRVPTMHAVRAAEAAASNE